MENKIPCIECNDSRWKYIEPYLKKWGYNIHANFEEYSRYHLLVINQRGELGECNNFSFNVVKDFNRYLVTNVEEFLEKAAKLKGFEYERKDMKTHEIHNIEIKPGMVILTGDNNTATSLWLVFPMKNDLGVISCGAIKRWTTLTSFLEEYKDKVLRINDVSNGGYLSSGTLLWAKPKKIVLSKTEIANKFGIDVNLIDIVE